jgi:hypothetical protein
METTDWQASRNSFRSPMEESVENALGISIFTLNALNPYQSDPNPGFGILFNEHKDKTTKLTGALGIKDSIDTFRSGYTKNMEIAYKDMAPKLAHFDDLVRPVFGKNTLEYNTIWGANRNRFYRGSYEERETAVKGLSEAMDHYPGLAAVVIEVKAYHEELVTARQAQQGYISGSKNYSASVFQAIENLILQHDRTLGWLKFYYALEDNAQAKVNSFFDISKIINHNNNKVYPRHVPISGSVRVCRRAFKESDKIRITVDGTEDVLISLVENSKTPLDPGKSYRAIAGPTVEKPVKEIFPDLTHKQVMGLNSSTIKPSHFVFEIIEA